MNIFAKILATILPLVVVFEVLTVGMTIQFSRDALTDLAETWLGTRLDEALKIAAEQEAILHRYGLEAVSASKKKAKMDAASAMAAIKIRERGYIFAVGTDGVIAMHTDASMVGRHVGGKDWFKTLAPGRGRLTFSTDRGKVLAMYDYFQPWDWYIFAADAEGEVYGAIDRIAPFLISLGVAGTIIIALVLMVFTRRLTAPLRSLTAGADRIGKGDLQTRIPVTSNDEFARLSEVFNQMALQLQETLTALQHREEHFRSLIENATDIITILDGDGRIRYESPSIQRVLGYPQDEFVGKPALDFIHPDDRRRIRRLFRRQVKSPGLWGTLEFRFRHQDGSWRTIEATSQNLLHHPAVSGIVINSRDITVRKHAEAALQRSHQQLEQRVAERTGELIQTNRQLRQEVDERKQAEHALRTSEQRMRAILRASPVGIGLVVDRKLEWANDTLLRLVEYPPDELVQMDSKKLYTSRQEYERVGRELYEKADASEMGQVETQWVRSDGTLFDCILRIFPLDPQAPSTGQIVAVTDISEAKRLEAKLQQAKKMEAIGTLAGGVAHDLNNILSGIVSYPELLLLEIDDGSPLKTPIQTIRRSGEKAAAIVQDLLTMARRGVAVTEVLNLNDIISDQLASPEFKNLHILHPKVNVSVGLEPRLPNMTGSSTHLSKSLMNLAANAAEAMPEGGLLTISTANTCLDRNVRGYESIAPGDYVVMTVSDTGTGIAEGDLEHIFEPFYTKKKMGRSGSGLGMAVVWGTVKDHQGYIDVKSREGRGTTFSLYFPVTREEVETPKKQLPLDAYQGNREMILVVDDSDEQREIAMSILSRLNYSVESVSSGEAAVEYVTTHSVDLLVLDMIMPPGMDGLATYQRIIALKPNLKAVIASGFSETARVREAQRLGAGRYIKKPYTIETIGMAVMEELKR